MFQVYVEMIRALMTREDEGQGMVEYALILAFIAVVCVVAVTALGENISSLLSGISFA